MEATTLNGELEVARVRRRLPEPRLRRLIREGAGVSQAAVATEVGVNRPSVSRWETGSRTPRGRDLIAYVAVLDRLVEEGRAP